jgi:hypothetical protein
VTSGSCGREKPPATYWSRQRPGRDGTNAGLASLAEGESLAAAALGEASDTMMAHPLALQLRNLQSLVEIGVDKNTTVVFPAPLMSTIEELGSFLAREKNAASTSSGRTPLVPGAAPAAVSAPGEVTQAA